MSGDSRLYFEEWKVYIPSLLAEIIKSENQVRNIDIDYAGLERCGNRVISKIKNFKLDIINGNIPIVDGKAYARDLRLVLLESPDFCSFMKDKHIIIQYVYKSSKLYFGYERVSCESLEESIRTEKLVDNVETKSLRKTSSERFHKNRNRDRDEDYVIRLCNEVIGLEASTQHTFDFLVGDSGKKLPVDAYYKDLNLVIEYYERQHTESVPFFNKRTTVSGVSRDEQRKIYDERRRTMLPLHGIKLVVISYSDFGLSKKIKRDFTHDIGIVKELLKKHNVL